MKTGDEKYEEIIKALSRTKPDPASLQQIEDFVMRIISEKQPSQEKSILDFLFGWIYIGWVRTSLVTATFCLIAFFVWQQNNILNRIDSLQLQIRQNDRMITYDPSINLNKKHLLNRISQEELQETITINKADLDQLIDSLDRVQSKYRDILEMIANDPALRKSIEQKLKKNTRPGLNL